AARFADGAALARAIEERSAFVGLGPAPGAVVAKPSRQRIGFLLLSLPVAAGLAALGVFAIGRRPPAPSSPPPPTPPAGASQEPAEDPATQQSRDLLEHARKNDGKTMVALGLALRDGRGVAKDEAETMRWFRAAAEARNANEMYELGDML